MDTVFKGLVITYILSFAAIIFMVYNRIRWHDELHGFFRKKQPAKEDDA